MMTFLFYFEAGPDVAGQVLQALGPLLNRLPGFRVETLTEAAVAGQPERRKATISPESKVGKIIRQVCADGQPHGYEELQDSLEAVGYSRNSVSPAVSLMIQSGELERVGPIRDKVVRRVAQPIDGIDKANPGLIYRGDGNDPDTP
jgi:hypothetical protein